MIFGKTSYFQFLDLNFNFLNKKVEGKDIKNLIVYSCDLEKQTLPKITENNTFKIYAAKFINHCYDYLVFGTNKGLIVYKFNSLIKPEPAKHDNLEIFNISHSNNTLNLKKFTERNNENSSNFHKLHPNFESKSSTLISNLFLDKKSKNQKYKIDVSFDLKYLSILNLSVNQYTIYNISYKDGNSTKASFDKVSTSDSINCFDLQWCPYDNIYCIINSNSINLSHLLNSGKESKSPVVNKRPKASFNLQVFKLENLKQTLIYTIDQLI